jgi:uncharacterized cupredoxin-like copper-binding protein
MKKNLVLCTVIFVLASIVSACGAGGPSTTIALTLTDFQFAPNSFTVPAGQEITFNASNNGAVVHNFVIMDLGTEAGEAFDDTDSANVFWEVEIPPAGMVDTSFTAPSEPGEYQIICSIEGHLMAGMVGKLIVVDEE